MWVGIGSCKESVLGIKSIQRLFLYYPFAPSLKLSKTLHLMMEVACLDS